jgi:hypothetical protein
MMDDYDIAEAEDLMHDALEELREKNAAALERIERALLYVAAVERMSRVLHNAAGALTQNLMLAKDALRGRG